MEVSSALVLVVPVAGVAALLWYLSRGRARVMGYHALTTPQVTETTHGAGGGDGG